MKVFASNKKALNSYELKEKLEAGIKLSGAEVKSVKQGNVSLKGAYVTINANEAFLLNTHIGPYKYARQEKYEPMRARKLLLHKSELKTLIGAGHEKGVTLFPIEMYEKRGLVKVSIGLGRGKKKYEKRESLKKKEAEREIERRIKAR